ncbi:hypothetical protein BCY86_03690 [Pajaroellobacter abortibovis]|uniref:Uncharacterized protein n=1 Tax=Pajaroellobacter abortibovis TaxID=1882918 RepID=A0A1L6MWS8_9BACT|nr:hypothetical protein BCY86_03690 [Pajaroellobacter abortibovis]
MDALYPCSWRSSRTELGWVPKVSKMDSWTCETSTAMEHKLHLSSIKKKGLGNASAYEFVASCYFLASR